MRHRCISFGCTAWRARRAPSPEGRLFFPIGCLVTFLFVYYSEYYSVLTCRELCCCSRNCCWFMLFLLLFIRFYVICQVLGGVPDNARVMGCTCANSPSLLAFLVCLLSRISFEYSSLAAGVWSYLAWWLERSLGVRSPAELLLLLFFSIPASFKGDFSR